MCSNKRTRGTLSDYIFYITDLENCVYINVYIQLCAAMDGAANVLGIKCVKPETRGRHCTFCLIFNKYLGFLGKKLDTILQEVSSYSPGMISPRGRNCCVFILLKSLWNDMVLFSSGLLACPGDWLCICARFLMELNQRLSYECVLLIVL